MENKEIVGTAMMIVGAVILIPMAIGGVYKAGCYAYAGAANGVNRVKFHKEMKKGIKEGRIIKLNGEYYNVNVENAEEEA